MLLFTVLEWASLYRLSTIYSVFELFCNVCFYTNSSVIGTFSCNQVWPDCGQGISSHTERSRVRIRHIQPQSPECVCVSCSVMSDSVASQAPLTMGFSKQKYWSGLSVPTPEDLPYPGIEPWSPALQADSLPFELQGSPPLILIWLNVSLLDGVFRRDGGCGNVGKRKKSGQNHEDELGGLGPR